MEVSTALRPALNRCVGGNRIGAGVAFTGIGEANRNGWLAARHNNVRDADRFAVVETSPEIGVQVAGQTDALDVVSRIAINWQSGDVAVRDIINGKERAAANTGSASTEAAGSSCPGLFGRMNEQ